MCRRKPSLNIPENEQRQQRDNDRSDQTILCRFREKIGGQRHHSPGDIRNRNGYGTLGSPFGIGFIEPQLKTHHEINPAFVVGTDRLRDRHRHLFVQAISPEDISDFGNFMLWKLLDFHFLTMTLGNKVFGIGFSGQIAPQPHRDRSCSNFCQTRRDDDASGIHGPR